MNTAEVEEDDILRIERELSKLISVATAYHSLILWNHAKDMLTDLNKEQAHIEELYQMEKKRKELEDDLIESRDESSISRLDNLLDELKFLKYSRHLNSNDIVFLQHIEDKSNDFKREMVHMMELDQMNQQRKELEDKVLNTRIPVLLDIRAFDKLREEAAQLETELQNHGDNCWASVNLRHALKDIKNKIEHLAEDNKITLGWTTATLSVAGASVGVAFIPIVGLPISALMNAVPYFGRLTHRLVVSHKRKKLAKN